MSSEDKNTSEMPRTSGENADTWRDIEGRISSLPSQNRRETLLSIAQFLDNDCQAPLTPQRKWSHAAENTTLTFEPSTRKLRVFSASSKPGSGEVDYKHWRRAALRISEDEEISEAHKKRIILQSLQGEAEDAVDLNRDKSAAEIIAILDKLYGPVIDGRELLANFYQQYQQSNQSASQYLNQLFLLLGDVVKSGTMSKDKLPQTLLTQFVRGIDDEELLSKLRLEDKHEAPPDFPDLLHLVRQEETRRQERRARHKHQARSQVMAVQEPSPTSSAKTSETAQLQQRIAELEAQMKDMGKKKSSRKVFCYRCGEDDHVATECMNPPNKTLVEKKEKDRRSQKPKGKNW